MSDKANKITVRVSKDYIQFQQQCRKTDQEISHSKLFEKMYDFYNVFGEALSEDDLKNLTNKAKQLDIPIQEALKTAVYFYLNPNKLSRKTSTMHKKTQQAESNLKQVIEHMMKHNEQAKDLYDKIFITRYSIKAYARDNKDTFGFMGFSEEVLIRAESEFASLLEQHHEKHKLDKNHNRHAAIKKRIKANA